MKTPTRFALVVVAACSSAPATSTSTTPTSAGSGEPAASPAAMPAATTKPSDSRLDKLMRTRMNKSYTQLVFFVLDSATDVDFAKIDVEAKELQGAVAAVRALPMPPMV